MNIVCLDMEGVLVPEIWIAFSEASGIPELRRTTRDEPDYDKLMRYRLGILKEHGLGLKEIQDTIAKIDPLPGAKEFLDELRSVTQVLILSDTFEEFAKLEKSLILEANFHKRELQQLQDIAKTYDYEVMTLVLEADLHILHERYMNRMKYENRHPVHMSARQDRFEDFKDYVECARKEGTVGTVIKICADDFSYRTDEELLQKIDCFMKEPAR